jgi:adenosylmethionine-8-amino-7-oxononanoate aminotransferase
MSAAQTSEAWHADKLARRLVDVIGRRATGQPMGRFMVAQAAAPAELLRLYTPADRLPGVLDAMAGMLTAQAGHARDRLAVAAATAPINTAGAVQGDATQSAAAE